MAHYIMCQIRLSVDESVFADKARNLGRICSKVLAGANVTGDHFKADRLVEVAFKFIEGCAVAHDVIEFDYESDVAAAVTRQNKRPDRLQNERALAI